MSKPVRSTASLRQIYDKTHWFTDKEAWGLFRFFAFAEAAGWTLLIAAITYRHFSLPQYPSVIIAAGRIHGLCFSLYFLFVLLTARSMGWGYRRLLVGLVAGTGPYTSLLFEKLLAHQRRVRPVYVKPPADIG